MKSSIQHHHRLLAAVMFIDIVGYSALMQKDESCALNIRNLKRSIVEAEAYSYQGKVIQYYGDGALLIFSSSYLAVKSAIRIQTVLQEKRIPVRIGIHSGEIVRDNEGIYGNAVNIASRLESLSSPGGILISGKVFYEIKNHTEITAMPVGKFDLKNIEQPVLIYSVSTLRSEVASNPVINIWYNELSNSVKMQLIRPYLSNMYAGLLN